MTELVYILKQNITLQIPNIGILYLRRLVYRGLNHRSNYDLNLLDSVTEFRDNLTTNECSLLDFYNYTTWTKKYVDFVIPRDQSCVFVYAKADHCNGRLHTVCKLSLTVCMRNFTRGRQFSNCKHMIDDVAGTRHIIDDVSDRNPGTYRSIVKSSRQHSRGVKLSTNSLGVSESFGLFFNNFALTFVCKDVFF